MKTITLELSEYEQIIKENEVANNNKTVIIKDGFYIQRTAILTNDEAVKFLAERIKLLEKQLEEEIKKPWWKRINK